MASDTELTLYKAVLETLCQPEALTALGTAVFGLGAYFNKRVKKLIKGVITALYKFAVGGEEKEQEGSAGEPHVLTAQFSQDTTRIQDYLEELQDRLDCARVSILQFHNGARFSLSNPVFKCSTSFEAISEGFAPSSPMMREMLVSIYTTFISPLMLSTAPPLPGVKEEPLCKNPNGGCPIVDVPLRIISYRRDDLRPGPLRIVMHDLGMEKMYAILLSVPDKGPVGVLTIQYHDETDADKMMTENACELCKTKQYIQSILYRP